jgi:uncharacterized membrane protein YgdD (TMEM256/DUF423 family)
MNLWLLVGAVNGFLAVATGAFGAHGLQGRIDAKALEVFNTGAHYHLIHALATAAVALALTGSGAAAGPLRMACALFTLGTVLFSGSLYFYAMTGTTSVVLATPIGGVCFLLGWAALVWAALKIPG